MDIFVGNEVYVIVSEEDTLTTIHIYDDIEEALTCLASIDPLEEPETKVFHGILTRAETIPAEITAKNCYIIAVNVYYDFNTFHGVLYESDCKSNPNALAEDIEGTISNTIHENNTLFSCEIDHMYILYGYELSTGLCINRESLDEEVIFTCKTIAEKAEEISQEYA
jgi:hypothetical protein